MSCRCLLSAQLLCGQAVPRRFLCPGHAVLLTTAHSIGGCTLCALQRRLICRFLFTCKNMLDITSCCITMFAGELGHHQVRFEQVHKYTAGQCCATLSFRQSIWHLQYASLPQSTCHREPTQWHPHFAKRCTHLGTCMPPKQGLLRISTSDHESGS